ncbi:MAG: 3-isopropylmalate dehydrogenase [Treponema sp.]|jgi:3-isopropylmalate dehydrogenase|nr:3-isopropylmalate dehydrogenase [Treponema sp.]
MNGKIAFIPGDGIGPEVAAPAAAVLDAAGALFGHVFHRAELPAGGRAVDETGVPLPPETLEEAKRCDAVFLGAVGGPKWDDLPVNLRPERALLDIRRELGVFVNLRPVSLAAPLRSVCPLKDEILSAGGPGGKPVFDFLIVRELTGGIYFGARGRSEDGSSAWDTESYSRPEIERVLEAAYAAAAERRKKVCVVDKANVLESSRLWRETALRMSGSCPGIETSFLYVDNAAMQLIRAPGSFDVIVTSNMFGDILSDEASALTGSIGMLPSASLAGVPGRRPGPARPLMGIYEPIHGSAPDIAGKDIANPLGAVLSAAMMLRYSFGLEKEAAAVEAAVNSVLEKGYRTADISGRGGKERLAGTREMGEAVVQALEEQA